MSTLDLFQQIYLQTFTINLGDAIVGPETVLQKAMNVAVKAMVNDSLGKYGWQVTWGPRVWKSPSAETLTGPNNSWMVLKASDVVYPDGTKFDTYVVAIAGTAVFSKEAWKDEDFGVNSVVDFNAYTSTFKSGSINKPEGVQNPPDNVPYGAWGTTLGAWAIVTNESPAGNPGAGTTILEYLAKLQKDPGEFRVIFTGHSLGGALSPYLSMAAKSNNLVPEVANPIDDIITLPAAGATPGEKLFYNNYTNLFKVNGPGGYKVWNADFFNTLDIVPQAWSTDDTQDRFLDKIVGIYGPLEGNFLAQVQGYVDTAKDRANASGLVYIPIKGNPFNGTPPSSPPTNIVSFLAEAAVQHTYAYYHQVKVGSEMAELYKTVVGAPGVQKKTARQMAKGIPVLCHAKPEELGKRADQTHPYDCILLGKRVA
ncbi:hypothetical protein ColLi_07684 [Colletotrichum liriopes]|uniref:Fungal lipase-type domain-containing protein n=1 Tax=Colletotrichum liriopes TaxID=708192 RepID=A0AA37GR09_9PEZI|nr:hypothetical protein ColLi_07684 [Colletotrichum liriopes]